MPLLKIHVHFNSLKKEEKKNYSYKPDVEDQFDLLFEIKWVIWIKFNY